MTNKHLRSVRHNALRAVLKSARGETNRRGPHFISQRVLADHVHRSQSWLALIESLQRRCDVLEFIDLGDATHDDRLALFAALIEQSPRRYFPITRKRLVAKKGAGGAGKARKKKRVARGK